MAQANTQVQGKIVQCIGAVVDVEFPRDQMPKVYDALKMEGSALGGLTVRQVTDSNYWSEKWLKQTRKCRARLFSVSLRRELLTIS
nr:hypothetical protein [Mycobacterium tuberculosis]